MMTLNSPVWTHVDHALSAAALRGELAIYGVSQQEARIRQQGKGSDVSLVMRRQHESRR